MEIKGKTDRDVLESSPYLKFSRKVPTASLIAEEIRKRNINIKVEMNIDSFAGIISMVSHGLGVSVVPEQAGREALPANIRKIPFGLPQIKRTLGIVYPQESTKGNIITALYSQLCSLCGYIPPGS